MPRLHLKKPYIRLLIVHTDLTFIDSYEGLGPLSSLGSGMCSTSQYTASIYGVSLDALVMKMQCVPRVLQFSAFYSPSACAAKVTVLVLCVCLCVCLRLFPHYRQRSGW